MTAVDDSPRGPTAHRLPRRRQAAPAVDTKRSTGSPTSTQARNTKDRHGMMEIAGGSRPAGRGSWPAGRTGACSRGRSSFIGRWSDTLDFGSLNALPASYVSRDLHQRHSDLVWRIRFQDERWLYVVVVLEFRSTIDQRMAVRMLTYTGLLYERLIADGALRKNDKLPPMLPIVIYNGARRWNAPTELHELIATGPSTTLAVYQPSLRYFLLDHGRVQSTGLPPDNLVSALGRAGNEHHAEYGSSDRPADRPAGGIRRPRPDGSIQRLGRRVAGPTDAHRGVARPADETEGGTHDAG